MLLRMTGQIKVSGDRFRSVFVVFLYVAKVFSESVAGDRGHQLDCIINCSGLLD